MQAGADVVIVGGGVAGMATALAATGRDILLVTKENLDESSTRYAQGGVAAAVSFSDDPDLHYEDTLRAGAGLCVADGVRILVDEGPDRVHELVARGTRFDRSDGTLALAREGGHTQARILRSGGDATGAELQRSMGELVRESDVKLIQDCRAESLIVSDGRCGGLYVRDHDGQGHVIEASAVVLATGGAGALYDVTTNPDVATADGLAMAIRAGVVVADLEFVQFHPTALVARQRPRPLVSEAVRGEGAVLRDDAGDAFMQSIHPLADLAPRDIVAAAEFEIMQQGAADHVWLDATGISDFESRFPTIAGFCADLGIDPAKHWLPVAPAAHYFCGGVVTDLWGRSSLPGLYACGEVAATGVHGANRLGSNSLLEGLVYGTRVGAALARHDTADQEATGLAATSAGRAAATPESACGSERVEATRAPEVGDLQKLMTREAGVVRSAETLRRLRDELARFDVAAATPETGFANLHLVARMVLTAALLREESRGGHLRSDHPESSLAWERHLYQRYLLESTPGDLPDSPQAAAAARTAQQAPIEVFS